MSELSLFEPVETPVAVQPSGAVVDILTLAVQRGADLATIERLMAMRVAEDERRAMKEYFAAFAAFKAEAVRIIKNAEVSGGPLSGKKYAELFVVINAITPALSMHGLSAAWKLTKDEKDWLEVTCTLRHANGYSESVSMGGPPDAGGAKNAIQARASTVSYLERYTLKAITGLAEQADDTDGKPRTDGPHEPDAPAELIAQATEAARAGTSTYGVFWAQVGKEARHALAGRHASFKVMAQAADHHRAGAA